MNKEEKIIRRKNKEPKTSILYRIGQILFYLPLKLIFPIKIYGKKNLGNRRLIITMNHKSGLDPVLMAHLFRPSMYFMAKMEFTKNKFMSWLLSNLGCIFVHRGEPDFSATKKVMNVLEDDKIFAIFPEGTRNKVDDQSIRKFRTGAAYYAIKQEAPILPMVIDKKIKAFHKNAIIVGDEFELSEYYGQTLTKELLTEATEIIYKKTLELQERLNIIKEKKLKK
ncbi:MAG: lysophospholipid acyltransferase family protein [Clostridia bacterium]